MRIMGILNLTPDSFSDGGAYPHAAAAIAAAHQMAADGAAIIDIGAESTRPGATPVSPAIEQARLLPIVRALAAAGLTLSIDTRNAATMAACLDAGAAIINDVSALRWDPAAAPLLAARDCPVILMHMRGTPQTMQSLASYTDVLAEIAAELGQARAAAEAAGIARSRILLDPGLGFAKTAAHSLQLLARLNELTGLGAPLVVGASRKRFIGDLTGIPNPADRLAGSLAAALHAAANGAAILRVHDVAPTVQALRVQEAIEGVRGAKPLTSPPSGHTPPRGLQHPRPTTGVGHE
jgi:dihydropteroate synthase